MSTQQFERKFEKYIGGGHTLSLHSGTAALHIALILAGVKEGDEVIIKVPTGEYSVEIVSIEYKPLQRR